MLFVIQMYNIIQKYVIIHYPTINKSWFDLIWFDLNPMCHRIATMYTPEVYLSRLLEPSLSVTDVPRWGHQKYAVADFWQPSFSVTACAYILLLTDLLTQQLLLCQPRTSPNTLLMLQNQQTIMFWEYIPGQKEQYHYNLRRIIL